MNPITITGAMPAPIPFFCDVTKVIQKHFGRTLLVKNEHMDLIRQAASVLHQIGEASQANGTKDN